MMRASGVSSSSDGENERKAAPADTSKAHFGTPPRARARAPTPQSLQEGQCIVLATAFLWKGWGDATLECS